MRSVCRCLQCQIEHYTDVVVVYRAMRRLSVANEVARRPPLPAIGKITGLGPGLSKIREKMAGVREAHDGLNDDLQAYGMAVEAVRDHVRDLHSDLAFEVASKGNGDGGQASQEQVERHVAALSGTSVEEVKVVEVGDVAPLTADPADAPGSEH